MSMRSRSEADARPVRTVANSVRVASEWAGRLLIVALTLAGAYAIVAALIAAKGIVRFPEISRDGPSGSKAEYFLVGSLVSWTVAVAAAGLLWLIAQSF